MIADYAWRNADLNLAKDTGTTNGFIFQMINFISRILGGVTKTKT